MAGPSAYNFHVLLWKKKRKKSTAAPHLHLAAVIHSLLPFVPFGQIGGNKLSPGDDSTSFHVRLDVT